MVGYSQCFSNKLEFELEILCVDFGLAFATLEESYFLKTMHVKPGVEAIISKKAI